MNLEKRFRYDGKEKLTLHERKTDDTSGFHNKEESEASILADIELLKEMQEKLYAQDKYAVLIVFQALDAAGKDSTISHVMSGVNPQGCQVVNFKSPSFEDLNHDYLWRVSKELPERGKIGIFNRSHYEEVLVTKVHPEFILSQKIPNIDSKKAIDKSFWQSRYKEITNYEEYLYRNGIIIIKFFLHLSKDEQKIRFLKRIEEKEKNWKFSVSDMKERSFWDEYQLAFEDAISHTATKRNPWYIIPADQKWFTRFAVSTIINERLKKLKLEYPTVSAETQFEMQRIKEQLLSEK